MERNRQEQIEEPNLRLDSKSNLEQKLGLGIGQTIQNWLQDFLKQLAERLEKMEEILVVDRIEGNIAVCENRKTKKMQDINLEELPEGVKEGSILKWKNGKYEVDASGEIESRIEQKMKDVWK